MWPFGRKTEGTGAPVEVPTVDVKQAFARSKRGARLVDVRSSREFAHSGHPKGAVSVPPSSSRRTRRGWGATTISS